MRRASSALARISLHSLSEHGVYRIMVVVSWLWFWVGFGGGILFTVAVSFVLLVAVSWLMAQADD